MSDEVEVIVNDPIVIKLSEAQFKRFDLLLNGINGAINKLADRTVEQTEAIKSASDNLGKWLAVISETLKESSGSQAQVDALTQQIHNLQTSLKTAVDNSKGE